MLSNTSPPSSSTSSTTILRCQCFLFCSDMSLGIREEFSAPTALRLSARGRTCAFAWTVRKFTNEFGVVNIDPGCSVAGESCARHIPPKRAYSPHIAVSANPPWRWKGQRAVVRLIGDRRACGMSFSTPNAKSQGPRVLLVWYWRVEPLGFDELATGHGRKERLAQFFNSQCGGPSTPASSILPAASMHVPLISWVDAIFWFTRQAARVNGGLSRNDSLRAGTCL